MTDHHAVNARRELAKNLELVRVQLRPIARNQWQIMMGVHRRSGVAGKMFSTTCDPLSAQRVVESAGQPDDFRDVATVTTPTQRIICLVVEGNVENRAKIEIESK